MLVGILFGPLALFVYSELIRSSTPSGTIGERKIVFLVSGPRFFSNTCKKVIKVVRNLFGTGY